MLSRKAIYGIFTILLISFLISCFYSCGGNKYEYSSLIGIIDDDCFEVIREDIALPDEFVLDEMAVVDESSFRILKGSWVNNFLRWDFTPQITPSVDNGIIEIEMKYLPPKRFKLSFSFRNEGGSFCKSEIFANLMRITKQSNGKSIPILESPLRFQPEFNVLRLVFNDDLLAMSFNGREAARIRDKNFTGKGTFNSISINSEGNFGPRTVFKYIPVITSSEAEPFARVFNTLLNRSISDDYSKYLREVRVGDVTMPSIMLPSPSKVVIPVSIPQAADLRFSCAILLSIKPLNSEVRFKVEFLERGEDKPLVLFNENVESANIFDQKWISCKVNLESCAEKRGNLIFSADFTGKSKPKQGFIALWGAPRILITPKRTDTRNVFLVTVSNLGSEALHLKENMVSKVPSLLNWATDSVIFENAYPSAKWVPASLHSILRGDADSIGLYKNWIKSQLKKDDINFPKSIAGIFREHGYDTAAFVQGVECQPFLGLFDGFNEYFNDSKFTGGEEDISDADKLAARASLWVEQRIDKSCFVHIHLNSLSSVDISALKSSIKDNRNLQWEFWRQYGNGLNRLDGSIGKLLRSLWKVGAFKSSLVVIAGINGIDVPAPEDMQLAVFGKDQYLKVPVIINIQSKFPPKGERTKMVRLKDIYATIFDLMDFDTDSTSNSISFKSSVEGDEEKSGFLPVIATELSGLFYPFPAFSVRGGKFKLLAFENPDRKMIKLYFDLLKDPYERVPSEGLSIDDVKGLDRAVKDLLDRFDHGYFTPSENIVISHYSILRDIYKKPFY